MATDTWPQGGDILRDGGDKEDKTLRDSRHPTPPSTEAGAGTTSGFSGETEHLHFNVNSPNNLK